MNTSSGPDFPGWKFLGMARQTTENLAVAGGVAPGRIAVALTAVGIPNIAMITGQIWQVTGAAAAQHLAMIHSIHWDPACCRVAGITLVGRIDMSGWHGMTTGTTAKDLTMIHCDYG